MANIYINLKYFLEGSSLWKLQILGSEKLILKEK